MTEYNKRGGSSGFGGRGGKPSFGSHRGGGSSFSKKNWGDKGGSSAPFTLFKAICAKCNKPCEVPFRPTGGKPVYCKECFGTEGGTFKGDTRGDRFPKKDFGERNSYAPRAESTPNNDAVMKQLETINTKLEQLIRAVEAL
ncbi:MAG: CxxC-x17-CxxC domain-containing protein [Patescibacteria group bacterium]